MTDDKAIPAQILEEARDRIGRAGGRLTIWAVLREDCYETTFGDGFYLHMQGVALNEADAKRLADLAPRDGYYRWHIRAYEIALEDGAPILLAPQKVDEEFKIADIIALLAEIGPGAATSRLYTGWEGTGSGPFVSLPLADAPPSAS
jgi:hypothetical protein